MTPVAIATEDELSEAIAVRLVSEWLEPHGITHTLRGRGFGYLRSRMGSWRQMAGHSIVLVLTDLDQRICPVLLRDEWADRLALPDRLLLRVAVREVEAWVLADHVAMRALIGARGVLPRDPDQLPDPKQTLLKLAHSAPRSVRDDLVRRGEAGALKQALGYNARLVQWVQAHWRPERAAERSSSLARTRHRLRETIRQAGL